MNPFKFATGNFKNLQAPRPRQGATTPLWPLWNSRPVNFSQKIPKLGQFTSFDWSLEGKTQTVKLPPRKTSCVRRPLAKYN